jgi:hypothetical protein
MTPEPPSSPDGTPLPPRHRPSLGNLSQDTTESDLWDFEDDLDLPEDDPAPKKPEAPRSVSRDIPAPRERQPGKSEDKELRSAAEGSAPAEEKIRMDVTKVRSRGRAAGPTPGPAKPESDFDDLENWDDPDAEPEIEELPAVEILRVPEPEPQPPAPEPIEEMKTAAASPAETAPLPPSEPDDEFSPAPRKNAEPVSLRPHLALSTLERVGLVVLLVLLLGGGATVFVASLNRLPVESEKAETTDFPIKGAFISVASATSYWRAPITEGPDADTFRRGTELLPVLELKASGGPAAIRVLFRGDDGTVVGDAVTRTIDGTENLTIPATAGFDDPGMHAAYRTGESKPWTIGVYEARSEDAAGRDYKKLFEMNISTDRR